MTSRTAQTSPLFYARLAGFLYLLVVPRGLIGLTSGAVAVSAPKGGKLHRLSGLIFACAMLLMFYCLVRVLFTQWHPRM